MRDVKNRVTQADIADQKAEFIASLVGALGFILLIFF